MTAISLKVTSAKLKVSSKVKFDRGFYTGERNSPRPSWSEKSPWAPLIDFLIDLFIF